jgi:hypothetical protein
MVIAKMGTSQMQITSHLHLPETTERKKHQYIVIKVTNPSHAILPSPYLQAQIPL